MPLQPTFWAKGFGMLIDRFGIPWIINSEQSMGLSGSRAAARRLRVQDIES
jgi:hypothetical protein